MTIETHNHAGMTVTITSPAKKWGFHCSVNRARQPSACLALAVNRKACYALCRLILSVSR